MNIVDEEKFPLTKLVRELPGRPHASTAFRWATRGVRGVKLETLLVGGKRYSSREAVRRFLLAVTAAGDRGATAIEPPVNAVDANLEKALDREGL